MEFEDPGYTPQVINKDTGEIDGFVGKDDLKKANSLFKSLNANAVLKGSRQQILKEKQKQPEPAGREKWKSFSTKNIEDMIKENPESKELQVELGRRQRAERNRILMNEFGIKPKDNN